MQEAFYRHENFIERSTTVRGHRTSWWSILPSLEIDKTKQCRHLKLTEGSFTVKRTSTSIAVKKNVKLEEALPWWEPEQYRQANIEISISAIRFWRKIEAFPQRVVERTVESISFAISPIKPLLRSEAAEHSANAFYIRLTVETMENYSNGFPSNLLNRYSKMFRRFA